VKRVAPLWPHVNSEVERQNSSILKRLKMVRTAGLYWRKELQTCLAIYRTVTYSVLGKSPAELKFSETDGPKLPDARFVEENKKKQLNDDGLRERDFWKKEMRKSYGETRQNKFDPSCIRVSVRLARENKVFMPINLETIKVIYHQRSTIKIEILEGAHYQGHRSLYMKYLHKCKVRQHPM
jgi:hypothetical protein